MRVLIIDTCYPAFLTHHYAASPGLDRRPYAEQWRALMDTFFGTADSYSHQLRELGHEAHEVVVNCEPLQRMWAREHGLRLRRLPPGRKRRLVEDVVSAQVEDFRPDVLYVQNLSMLDAELLGRLGRQCLVVGQIASPPPPERQLRAFDLILTSFPHFVERFRGLGLASEYFRLGFDPRILDRLGAVEAHFGAVFVGNLGSAHHARGNDLLERVAARTRIDVWGYGLAERSLDSSLGRHYHGEAWGIEMFRVLAQSRISVNRHIDVAENYANNMRLYEATGVGSLVLTDAKSNLGELFDVGHEVVAYRDEEELIQAVEHYLTHEDERATIAAAGQQRTLRDHTFGVRMRELVEILDSYLH